MNKRKHLEIQMVSKGNPSETVTRTQARKMLRCRASETVTILDAHKVVRYFGTLNKPFKRYLYNRREVEAVAVLRREGKK